MCLGCPVAGKNGVPIRLLPRAKALTKMRMSTVRCSITTSIATRTCSWTKSRPPVPPRANPMQNRAASRLVEAEQVNVAPAIEAPVAMMTVRGDAGVGGGEGVDVEAAARRGQVRSPRAKAARRQLAN